MAYAQESCMQTRFVVYILVCTVVQIMDVKAWREKFAYAQIVNEHKEKF